MLALVRSGAPWDRGCPMGLAAMRALRVCVCARWQYALMPWSTMHTPTTLFSLHRPRLHLEPTSVCNNRTWAHTYWLACLQVRKKFHLDEKDY